MKVKITQKQKEFFAGCMLGDGNIKKPKGCINAMFQCQHGPKQIEYNKWKCNLLKSLGCKFYTYEKKDGYIANSIRTNVNSNITYFYNILYKNGKKRITNELLEHFTSFSLAVLYMDDGSKSRKDLESSTYIIASCAFPKEDLELFSIFLFNKFRIETTITKNNRLYIKMNSRNLFESLIIPHVKEIPSMLYKIRKTSPNSVNCLGSPEEGNQQPSLSGDTLEGSTTSSESHVDNNSTTKAGYFVEYSNDPIPIECIGELLFSK